MSNERRDKESVVHYRLEVEGELGDEWADWFAARSLRAGGGRTVVDLEVVDQAQLQGILRRLPDLHLTLVSLTRLDPSTATQRGTR